MCGGVPYNVVSCTFQSRIFHPCSLVPNFQVSHFPVSRFQCPPRAFGNRLGACGASLFSYHLYVRRAASSSNTYRKSSLFIAPKAAHDRVQTRKRLARFFGMMNVVKANAASSYTLFTLADFSRRH